MHIFIIILMLFVEMLSLGPGCMRNSTVRDTGTRQISGPAASSSSLSSVETFLSKRGRLNMRIISRENMRFYIFRSQIILMRQIRAGKLNFATGLWREVSLEAKDLLSKLLTVNLDERITVEECLKHKFLKSTSVNSSFDDELEALGLRIEGIEILKQKELLYNNRDSISDTNIYV